MKLITKENFRVIVYPENLYYIDKDRKEKQYEIDCGHIKQQIERHVDDFSFAEVAWDIKETCSHCSHDWEVDKETGEPLCCQKAIDERKQSERTA